MPAADEILNLILNVQGRVQVADLTEEIKKETEALENLIATQGLNAAATRLQSDTILSLNTRLQAAQETVKKTGTAMAASASATRGASQAAIEFSRGIEDLATGGFLGILNNIPRTFEGIGQAVGMSAGKIAALSTGISLAATGAYVLYRNWDTVTALFGKKTDEAIDAIDKLKKRIKELEDKPTKLAIDVHELDAAKEKLKELEAAQRAYKAAGEGKTSEEKEAGDTFRREFEETGGAGKAARDAVAVAVRRQAEKDNVELGLKRKEIADLEAKIQQINKDIATGSDPTVNLGFNSRLAIAQREIAAARDKAQALLAAGNENANRTVGNLFEGTKAGNNPEARQALAELFRKTGQDRFAEMAEGASPEKMRQKAREDAAIDNQRRMAKLDEDLKKKEAQRIKDEAADFDRDAGETYRTQMAAKADPAIARQLKAEDASIKALGAVPVAASLLARAGAARDEGVQGFAGRTDDQIFDMVRNEVDKELRRRNPTMMGDQRRDLATKITSQGNTELEKRMMGLNASELSNTGKLLGIASQLDGEVARLTGMVNGMGRVIDQVAKRGQARRRTALPRG